MTTPLLISVSKIQGARTNSKQNTVMECPTELYLCVMILDEGISTKDNFICLNLSPFLKSRKQTNSKQNTVMECPTQLYFCIVILDEGISTKDIFICLNFSWYKGYFYLISQNISTHDSLIGLMIICRSKNQICQIVGKISIYPIFS